MESTCGALIGAVLVAGVLTGGTGTPRIAKQLLQAFQQASGATICKDLKGVQTGTPLCSCPGLRPQCGLGPGQCPAALTAGFPPETHKSRTEFAAAGASQGKITFTGG